MAYTPKQNNNQGNYNKPQTAAPAQSASEGKAEGKVAIAGSIHLTPAGEKKGERLCNLFKNEKDGKSWLSGKDKDGNRFTIFLN